MGFDYQSCNVNALLHEELLGSNEIAGTRLTVAVCLVTIVTCFVLSLLTGNYSQVDKIWSIVPAVYSCILVNDERTFLMAVVSTLWAVRLTWNFSRRGGYTFPPWDGEEDYRWAYLRKGFMFSWLTHPVVWQLFNIFFICIYQNFLLWLMVAPSVVAHSVARHCASAPLSAVDWIAAGLVNLGIFIETLADNQQFSFQQEKYRQRDSGVEMTGEYKYGFKSSGLFAIVRKPNYAAEQSIWIAYYLFSIAATEGAFILNWSIVGCVLLCMLFQGSGWFTESITLEKYPKYSEYQKTTPLYFPNLWRLSKEAKMS